MTDSLGTRLRKARRRAHMTLADVSERVHVGVPYLSKIERDRERPSIATLAALCELFDLDLTMPCPTCQQTVRPKET